MSYLVDSILVGEVGDKNVEIHESVLSLSYSLSATAVSEIKVDVHDPNFRMHNNNYFMVGRRVTYDGVAYEISAVELKHGSRDQCVFTARLEASQKMRREIGQENFGSISPTTFAANVAKKYGLKFFGQESPVDGQIVREANENKDESTMDVLQRLARDLDFMCFEAKGILFFASQEYIMENQAYFVVNVPSGETDPFYASSLKVRRTTDGKSSATISAELIKNVSTLSIYPGSVVKVKGLSHFDTFMVDRVNYNASPTGLISISGTSPQDSVESSCELQTFAKGSKGDCVKRIQQAVGTIADGDWGPVTNRYVLQFQSLNGLPQDGIFDKDDWDKIKGDYVRPSAGWTSGGDGGGGLSDIEVIDVFPTPRGVARSKGWEYVRRYNRLPLPYPWNNGIWNPDDETGYDFVVSAMNEWIQWLSQNSFDTKEQLAALDGLVVY